ncbi:hypothetical protein [Spirochaeta africana]|uniref:Uncharacterized protein n=1 Tax=Spirochaeta africana (strain ATCC 700263 / DSM 8902 / Z-7692) TaxID=889378 RepID=H9UI30_SPIAZ|nr:hypothetical protein [Spirochaeta africana]AFG37173.1 hypothetical protein Spiaf_1086 [Spirochaeta africana DSM 8902]
MKRLRCAAAAAIVLLAAACATVPPSQQKDSVLQVLQMLEDGRGDELVLHSQTPFLLDAEIIEAESDVAELWRLLTSRGYRFPQPVVERIIPLGDADPGLFGDTMEVRVFFERYLPEDAAVAEVRSGDQQFRFIFADSIGGRRGLPVMYGWKGPL